ncbi:hypothetical protein ACA910_002990 [Epithemia clementina (nom. ined.)]
MTATFGRQYIIYQHLRVRKNTPLLNALSRNIPYAVAESKSRFTAPQFVSFATDTNTNSFPNDSLKGSNGCSLAVAIASVGLAVAGMLTYSYAVKFSLPLEQFGYISNLISITACDQDARGAIDKNINEGKAPAVSKESTLDGKEDDDLYANLPDEDEPTDCSMCLTFRQGPCRPFWRKLERCFKDNDADQEKGAARCVRYFKPHQECLMDYMNLYLLLQHEMKQEMIEEIELAFRKEDERRSLAMPNIDWSLWQTFLKEQGPQFRQTKVGLPKETPLWKRLPEDTEPVLVNLSVALPQVDESTKWILKLAYMLDQDGKVLGFVYNEAYSDLTKEAKKKGEKTDNNDGQREPKQNTKPGPENVALEGKDMSDSEQLDFVIMPGETKAIQLKALYSENPLTAPADKELLDGCLYETPLDAVPARTNQHVNKKKQTS